MTYAENLWLFSLLLAGIIVVPGMDMIFVIANGLTGGRRAGIAATSGIMLGGACGVYELGTRLSGHWAYRGGFAVAILGGFLMTWVNLAVGIVGNENNPVNLLFFAILVVGAIAAPLGRFRARGMARAMYATAIAQGLVTAYIAIAGHGYTFVLAGLFIAVWLSAAHLFLRADEDAARAGAGD